MPVKREIFDAKKLLAWFLVLGCFACKSKSAQPPVVMSNYIVITQAKGVNPASGRRERQVRETTVEAISDSSAFLKGIQELIAELQTYVFAGKDSVGYLEFDPHDLDVLDANRTSIVNRLPKSVIEYGLDYFESNKSRRLPEEHN